MLNNKYNSDNNDNNSNDKNNNLNSASSTTPIPTGNEAAKVEEPITVNGKKDETEEEKMILLLRQHLKK